MRTERDLLVDCLERLNRLSVPYMLVGSMASNYLQHWAPILHVQEPLAALLTGLLTPKTS